MNFSKKIVFIFAGSHIPFTACDSSTQTSIRRVVIIVLSDSSTSTAVTDAILDSSGYDQNVSIDDTIEDEVKDSVQ